MKASGLGATGCTGLVCLAASFFRLILLLSNISCMDACFWKTFSTWSCSRQEDIKETCDEMMLACPLLSVSRSFQLNINTQNISGTV